MWNSNGNGNHHGENGNDNRNDNASRAATILPGSLRFRWQHFHREQRATACRVVSSRSRFATFTAAAFIRLPKSKPKPTQQYPHSAHPMHHAPHQPTVLTGKS
jgi:hypothetical protein